MIYIMCLAFIVLDFMSGLAYAFMKKVFTSSIMREGLFHKLASIFAIVFGNLVDYAQTLVDLGVTIPVAKGICAYIILMECGSIIENVGKINPDILPSKLKSFFSKLK